MRYFWHGAFVGSFFFAPWWTTVLTGIILGVLYCPEWLILVVFILMDLIQFSSANHFYFAMPLTLLAIVIILTARVLRTRIWLSS